MQGIFKSMAATLLLANWASGVMAQEQVNPGASAADDARDETDEARQARTLDRVVVTANRREQNVEDIGLAISTIGAEELQERRFNNPADLAQIVPGFSFTQTDVNVPVYTLRGVGFNESSLAASPTVSVYVDEVSLPYPIMTKGAALDLQRVEVLKGPQGTLYGRNTTGGAINYIANKPTDVYEAGFKVGYGNFNAIEADAYVSGPIAENLRTRFAARFNQADGWQKSQTRQDTLGRVDQIAGRWVLDWEAGDALDVSLIVSGWSDTGDTLAPALYEIAPTSPANALPEVLDSPLAPAGDNQAADWDPDVDFSREDTFAQLALRADWALGENLTLTSISARSQLETESGNERDGMALNNSRYQSDGAIDSFSQELRLAGQLSGGSQWVVGANYSNDETKDENYIFVDTLSQTQATGIKLVGNFADQEIETIAAFASVDWALTDRTSLTTGLRYTEVRQDFVGCSFDPGDGNATTPFIGISAGLRASVLGLPPLPASAFQPGECYNLSAEEFRPELVEDELDEDNVSWRLALEHRPREGLLVFGSVSQGYKTGSFPTISASSSTQYAPVTQESLLAYEAGVKASLFNRSMQANFTSFYYDYQDKQLRGRVQDPVFSTLQKLVNIPEASVQGVEGDLVWLPADGLTLSASFAWIDSEIEEYTGFDQFGTITDFAGKPFNYSPEWQTNLGADYEWSLGPGGLMGFAGANYAWRSETTADFGVDPRFDIDSYGLLDLRIGIRGESGWSVMVWGENVTDEYYYNNALRAATDGIVRYVGQPPTYGVRFGYDFQ